MECYNYFIRIKTSKRGKQMNITGKLNRSEIVDCPKDATLALMSKDGESFIQLFYREVNIVYNILTTQKVLQFQSSTGVWFNSIMSDYELKEAKFKVIEG